MKYMHPRPSSIVAALYTARDLKVDVAILHGPSGCSFKHARLLEEEGIFYFFEHGDEETKLIFADGNNNFQGLEGFESLTFDPRGGTSGGEHRISALTRTRRMVTTKVTVRDYNYRTPSTELVGKDNVDPDGVGVGKRWFADALEDTVVLPGTTDTNRKGTFKDERAVDRLSRVWYWKGPAWYQRDVNIPASWKGKRITLLLERTKYTQIWLDDTPLGENPILCTPQEYVLGAVERLGGDADIGLAVLQQADDLARAALVQHQMHLRIRLLERFLKVGLGLPRIIVGADLVPEDDLAAEFG